MINIKKQQKVINLRKGQDMDMKNLFAKCDAVCDDENLSHWYYVTDMDCG